MISEAIRAVGSTALGGLWDRGPNCEGCPKQLTPSGSERCLLGELMELQW